MLYDLVIHHARLHGREGLVDIAVQDGNFARIAADLSPQDGVREMDVAGRLVVPPFIDAHVHLDAALTRGQPRSNATGTLLEGIQIWSERKAELTHEDVKRRALGGRAGNTAHSRSCGCLRSKADRAARAAGGARGGACFLSLANWLPFPRMVFSPSLMGAH